MRYLFIADYFITELPLGGSEVCNDVLIKLLTEQGHEIVTVNSESVTPDYLESIGNNFDLIIVGSHQKLSHLSKVYLSKYKYIIYEHDFGILALRDPSRYENYIAPKSHRFNTTFYKNAEKVICQSEPHKEKFLLNYDYSNVVHSNANPFAPAHLDLLTSLCNTEKTKEHAVLDHPFWQKNTKGAIDVCSQNNLKFEIVPRLPNHEFLRELAKFKALVFAPLVFESFCRVCAEARCLNLDILTNTNVSFCISNLSKLKGVQLIETLRENNNFVTSLFA